MNAAPRPLVLIVEDDPGDALLVRRELTRRRDPYQVHHCERLATALEVLAERAVDVVLLDLSLPDSQGLDSIHALRRANPDVPIILLTGLDDDQLATRALQNGAQDYLTKDHVAGDRLARAIDYSIQRQRVVAENERLVAELEQIVRNDPLTGILNRHHFAIELDDEWRRAEKTGRPLACIILDIDFFKKINDTHGHVFGDRVLRRVGRLLAAQTRSRDHVARYGGEEFCLVLPDTTEFQARQVAEHLRREIASLSFTDEDRAVPVTASFGVASRMDDTAEPQELVNLADQALLVAKHLGRNRVTSYGELSKLDSDNELAALVDAFDGAVARDVMNPIVVALRQSQPVADAVDLLLRMKIEAAPVVNDRGVLVGLISEDELTAPMASRQTSRTPLVEIMHRQPVSFHEDCPVRAIHEFFSRVSVRRVTVESLGQPVGVITRASLLRWLRNRQSARREQAEKNVDPKRLERTLIELKSQVEGLHEGFRCGTPDNTALLIASATRIQDLTDEVLGHAGDGVECITRSG